MELEEIDCDFTTSTSTLLTKLAEIEGAADDVLIDRAQIVELDKKRQESRVAERHLKAMVASKKRRDDKTWFCFGNTFIKLPTTTAHSLVQSNQKAIDQELNNLRDGLKEKVNKLRQLEGSGALNPAYYLTPVSSSSSSLEDVRSGSSSKDL